MIQVRTDLASVRKSLRRVNNQELSRQMTRGFRRATKPLKPAIQASAVKVLPSGYGKIMSKSVRVRTAVQARSVSVTVYGDGKSQRRDLPQINKGILRHPVYGRHKQSWVAQRVRRGFVDRPVDGLTPDAAREMRAVVDWVADQIKGS